jgi:hypothetical protein
VKQARHKGVGTALIPFGKVSGEENKCPPSDDIKHMHAASWEGSESQGLLTADLFKRIPTM